MYVVVETQQLVNEIICFSEVLYKKGDLKNFSKFTDKEQSSQGVLSKDVIKKSAKVTDKNFCR